MRAVFFIYLIFNFFNSYSQVIRDTSFYIKISRPYYEIYKSKVNFRFIKNNNINQYEINIDDKKYLTLELPNLAEIVFEKLIYYSSGTFKYYNLKIPNKTWEGGSFKYYDSMGKVKFEGEIIKYFNEDSVVIRENIYIGKDNKYICHRTDNSTINFAFYDNYVYRCDSLIHLNKNQIEFKFYKNGIIFMSKFYENGKLKTLNEDYFVSEWDNFNKISELATSQFHKTIYFKKEYKYLNGYKYYTCIKSRDTLTQIIYSIDGKIKYFYKSLISKNSKVSPVYLDADYCNLKEPLVIATFSNLLPLEFIKYHTKSGKEEYHSISKFYKNNKVEFKTSFLFKDSIYEFQSKFYIFKNKKRNKELEINFDKPNKLIWNLKPNKKYFEYISFENYGDDIFNTEYPIYINDAISWEYVEILPIYYIILEANFYYNFR
jgi:hypothetical protein